MIIRPTRWPLFEFHLVIWKFSIRTCVVRDVPEMKTYEYFRLDIYWGNNKLLQVKLFDTWERIDQREK